MKLDLEDAKIGDKFEKYDFKNSEIKKCLHFKFTLHSVIRYQKKTSKPY